MSDCLREEILIKILARLPVKSLLQFRCVSKSWYSLISSPYFMNTHLNVNKNNGFLLLKHTYLFKDKCYYSLNDDDTLDEYARFECPFMGDCIDFEIVGSCNGLLCFSDFFNTTMILWNPSIKKFVTLPTPSITYWTHGLTIYAFGLGFDSRANDYKVVRVVQQHGSKIYTPEVELCELSKGSWRGISCTAPPYLFSSYFSQVYINGVVHWVALDKSGVNGDHSLIVAFDLVYEVFREMAFPDSIADSHVTDMSIGTFEESLVVYHLNKLPSDIHCTCSVWVMKEYGVAKSWVNQLNIVLEGGLKTVKSLMKNDELLLGMTSGQLVLYNPKDQQIKDVELHDPNTRSGYVGTYMESLVLLKGRWTNSWDAVTSKRKEDEMRSSSAKQCQRK